MIKRRTSIENALPLRKIRIYVYEVVYGQEFSSKSRRTGYGLNCSTGNWDRNLGIGSWRQIDIYRIERWVKRYDYEDNYV